VSTASTASTVGLDYGEYDPGDYEEREPTAEERLAAQLAHAASLDPNLVTCDACGASTEEWVVRRGMNGTGICRACSDARSIEGLHGKAFVQGFYEALARLQQLREERNKKIAEELAAVPF